MKNILKTGLIIMGSAVLVTSCSKSFLNTQPLDKAAAGPTWSDPSLAESFVTNIYNVYHDGLLNQEGQDCFTDNCLYNFGRADIMESNISPGNTGTVINTTEWGEMYSRIRASNVALENLAKAPFDKAVIDRLKGESYFLRAHCYNQLIRYYGGVPLIKAAYTLDNPDFSIARNTYDDCVKSIVSDLDSAKLLLTGKTMAAGRATPEAAMALKARVLIYAASDLHDMATAKAKSTLLNGYAKYEYLGYTSGDRVARYTAARDAAKAVIDLNKFGYQLNLSAPQAKDAAIASYTDVYLSRNGGQNETILAKYYINASTDDWVPGM